MRFRIQEGIERLQNRVLRANLDAVLCVRRSFCRVRSTSLLLISCMLYEASMSFLSLTFRYGLYLHIVWWYDHLKGLYGRDMAVLISKSV